MSARFKSPWASDLDAFLRWKRALGITYSTQLRFLCSFDRTAALDVAESGEVSLQRAVTRWLRSGRDRNHSSNRFYLSLITQFCRFLRRQDPHAYVPERDLIPTGPSRYRAHIFSQSEIRSLLCETQKLRHGPKVEFRRATLRVMLLVYLCTGLRPVEGVRLELQDLHLRTRRFFIRKTKGRSRWVPFRDDLAQALRRYLQLRVADGPDAPNSPLFVHGEGKGYTRHGIAEAFRTLCRRAGIKPQAGRIGPRLMDMRHTFAVNRITQWCREGVDLDDRLPYLSAYMGHVDLLGTQTYVTCHPELLRLASRRFAIRVRRKKAT
jgi:integrase/recombinase XerD